MRHQPKIIEAMDAYQARIRAESDQIDSLPPEIRVLVGTYGWPAVKYVMGLGFHNATSIGNALKIVMPGISPS